MLDAWLIEELKRLEEEEEFQRPQLEIPEAPSQDPEESSPPPSSDDDPGDTA